MSDLAAIALVVTGAVALVIAIYGSHRRDAAWSTRFRVASSDEERQRLMVEKPRVSWVWMTSHMTVRWGLAFYGAIALVVVAKYWLGL